MKKLLVAAVLTALALTTSACGNKHDTTAANSVSDSVNKDDATAAKSISDSIMTDQQSGSSSVMSMDQKDADCIGKGLVDRVGTDKLQKYGLLTKDLRMNKDVTAVHMSAEDANASADTFFACTDVMGMINKAMRQGGKVDPRVQACIDKALTKDAVHQMFVSMFSGKQQAATQDLTDALMRCAVGPSPAG